MAESYPGAVYRTARWLRLTAHVRGTYPICQLCGTKPSECTDHVDSNTTNWALDNMRALCWSCHSWKTKTPYNTWPEVVQAFKTEMFED